VVISWHSRDRSTQKSAKNKNHPHKLQDFLFLKASCKGVVSDATKRALAAEACMKAEQKSLEQSRQNAAKLLAEAESVEDDILTKKQTLILPSPIPHTLSVNVTWCRVRPGHLTPQRY